MSYGDGLDDNAKVKIANKFLSSAPPGEFNEVFNDVRVLLGNDHLLKEGAAQAFAEYNMDQFTPAKLPGTEEQTIISKHGLEGSRYLDPRSKQTFKYDHLRKEPSDPQPASIDNRAEPYRAALEKAMQVYIKEHYPNGVLTVYGSSNGGDVKLVACIEDHKFSPQNFWNGRWRSEWTAVVSGGSTELKGNVRVQVHYYEDGNVQLVSNKSFNEPLKIERDEEATAKNFVKIVSKSEENYQSAINENYRTMSQTTFKALRRNLPITRTKIDWSKILFKNVRDELRH
uniref:F-actin-capping protein subunit alpha n=1 Tax=Halisarca dujardinii TaxID=2583056 RepID=A0A9F1UCP8_HALDU|nr:CAPZA [Halisarca dujardinii]